MLELAAVCLLAVTQAMSGEAIAEKIANRIADDERTGQITFTLRDSKGRERERTARLAVRETDEVSRMLLLFDRPANIRDTAFLSFDYVAPEAADETWLFLPSTERVRRIPSTDRSGRFMATELTYGDVKDDFKFGLADYDFEAGGEKNGRLVLIGTSKSPQVARETGYGGFRAEIDPETWFPMLIDFADPEGEPLKTIEVNEVQRVGDSWTAKSFEVVNHKTGRSTSVRVDDSRVARGLSATLFDARDLDRAGSQLP
ncbi:outer membrane lipoprotein-sorting protein [Parvularcula lutaonensis]|uniref:Outer membrane lipoprotein-sorting protein n=1 Tax=Parvularcula lutaonensis TaxID=491923 RepID=A0ABV7MAZ1_9PROT|nr:outer membrane lipoprotein-sorting protein [Parvularcula lutaonensis]GGY45629.1 hypothetical protein GCM10007148_13310 [Parvularcula lutaonensis]